MPKRNFYGVPIQKVEDYWNERPCNIRHSIKPVGTREYFNEVESRRYFVEPHIPIFADFERWRGKKVLEIGCGIGTDIINFARSEAEITAVDISEKSLEIARKRAEVFGLQDRIKFFLGSAEKLCEFMPYEQYDLIYSLGVIHHTPHPELALDQIRHYVHENSVLKLLVYNHYSWKALMILLGYGKGQFWRLNELIAQYSEAQEGSPVTYTYTKDEVRKMLEGNGYWVNDITVFHIFPYSIPDYVQYRYKKVWYFRYMPEPLFRWLEHSFGWHLCITASIKEKS
jgi:ubiquinone/menaquinone biosynthesis C-methylase UbiE